MRNLFTTLTTAETSQVAVTLGVNLLLQSTCIILVGLAVARLMRSKGAAVQSVVLRVTLAAVVLCPLASFLADAAGVGGVSLRLPDAGFKLAPESPGAASADVGRSLPPAARPPTDQAPPPKLVTWDELPGVSQDDPDMSSTGNIPTVVSPSAPVLDVVPTGAAVSEHTAESLPNAGRSVPALIYQSLVTIWLIGASVLLGRLGICWLQVRSIRRAAHTAGIDMTALCREIAQEMSVPTPDVRLTPRIASPCLIGLRHPTILLPIRDDNGLGRHRDVFIHEFSHLARRDLVWHLLGQMMTSVLFYQPLLWVLVRRMEQVSDDVCDDVVVHLAPDRRSYARRLVDIAQAFTPFSVEASVGVGVVAFRSSLHRRVARIMDESRRLSTRAGLRVTLTLALLAACGTIVAGGVRLADDRSGADSRAEQPAPPQDPNEPMTVADASDQRDKTEAAPPAGSQPVFDGDLSGIPENERVNRLIDQINAGNLDHVRAILDRYPALIEAKYAFGTTPLQRAAMANNLTIAELLIKRGADVNARERQGFTILDRCANYGYVEMGELLIAHGADPNAANPKNRNLYPIHTAISEGQIEFVKMLLNHSADINAEAMGGMTPVQAATILNQAEIARFLMEKGAKLDLMSAAGIGRLELVKAFLQAKPEGIKQGPGGLTPLHAAAMGGQPEVVRFLVTQGAAVDAQAEAFQKRTALAGAAYNGHAEAVRVLIEAGADVEVTDSRNDRPIQHACFPVGHLDVVKVLLDHGAKIDGALSEAANSGSTDVVEFLLARGAEVNEGRGKWMPLHHAAGRGLAATVEILLDAGADVNGRAERGKTPLHSATFGLGDNLASNVVEILLARGADVNAQNDEGDTPLHQAGKSQHTTTAQLLLTAKPDLTIKNKQGQTPYEASTGPIREIIDAYIKNGPPSIPAEERVRVVARSFLGSVANDQPRWLRNLILPRPPSWTAERLFRGAKELRQVYRKKLSRLYENITIVVQDDLAVASVPGPTDASGRYLFIILQHLGPCWRAVYMDDSLDKTPPHEHLEKYARQRTTTGPSASVPLTTRPAPGSANTATPDRAPATQPMPLLLAGGRGIAVAIEDNGHSGERFKPVILHTSLADNWRSGVVGGDSPHRWGALAEPLEPQWYGGGPFLRQLPSGETLLSYQESADGTMDRCRMAVCVGDENARNFTNKTYPSPSAPRRTRHGTRCS